MAAPSRLCRTPDESFAAGFNAPCTHGIHPVPRCPACRLTPAEIARLVVLHRPYLAPATPAAQAS